MSDLLVRGKLKNTYFSYFLMFNFYYLGWALFSALISIYLIGLGFSAGYLYDAISPSAIFIAFVVSILICIIGTLRIDVDPVEAEEIKEKDQMTGKEEKTGFRSLLANRKYVYYLVVYALFTGVTQATHTFVPSMFTYEGLPASAASTILSIAVLCELPLVFFSGKFMDRWTSKKLSLIAFSLAMIQLLIYGLNMPMAAKIGITLLAKHLAGMLLLAVFHLPKGTDQHLFS